MTFVGTVSSRPLVPENHPDRPNWRVCGYRQGTSVAFPRLDRHSTRERQVRIPCEHLQDGDYLCILAPSPTQRTKLIEAIQSLRLVEVLSRKGFEEERNQLTAYLGVQGVITKLGKPRSAFYTVRTSAKVAELVENPTTPFDFKYLTAQIKNECVGEGNNDTWTPHPNSLEWCQPLFSKINVRRFSAAWSPIFETQSRFNLHRVGEIFFQR